MIHVAFKLKLRSCIHTRETGWQSGVRSCNMLGLSTHLMRDLNVGIIVKLSGEAYFRKGAGCKRRGLDAQNSENTTGIEKTTVGSIHYLTSWQVAGTC